PVRNFKRREIWACASWTNVNSLRCYNLGLMKKFAACLLVSLTVCTIVAAQRGPQQTPTPATPAPATKPQDQQTISIEVNLVPITVSVADRKGKFVTNLKREDFKVFEDDKVQTITNFSSESNLPLTIALLVDTSGSIRDKLRFEEEAA